MNSKYLLRDLDQWKKINAFLQLPKVLMDIQFMDIANPSMDKDKEIIKIIKFLKMFIQMVYLISDLKCPKLPVLTLVENTPNYPTPLSYRKE